MKIFIYISEGIAIIGIFIFLAGTLITFYRFLKYEVRRIQGKSMYLHRDRLRYVFGSYLLLGLEFLIVADIIATLTHRTLKDIAILGSIVIIRSIITFFLDREREFFHNNLEEEEKKKTL